MIKYWVILLWLPIFLIGILVNVSTAVLSNQLFWWLTLGFRGFPRFYLLSPNALGGPVLESHHMREQEVPPHPKHTTHWAVKRTRTIKRGSKGREKKKKRGKKKEPVWSFYAPADQYLYIKLLEHCSSIATLQPYSWRVHITCFPFESTFPRTLASWHGVGKLKGKKSLHILKKTLLLAKPQGNVNSQRKRRGSHETLSLQ